MKFIIDSTLFSYAQIFFSNRKWFGGVVLAATFITPQIGLFALEGLLICNFLAIILKFDKEKIRNGFYGFNGILFGAATGYFFELSLFLLFLFLIFIVITFFLSVVLEHFLAFHFNLPGLSLPFIFSLYIFLIFITNYNTIFYKGINFVEYEFLSFLPQIVQLYLKSFSLIMFQSSILSGILLIFGVLFFSRILFFNSLIVFAANYYFVGIIFPNATSDIFVLTAFNAILTSFALGGSLIIVSRKSFLLILISSIMIIIFTGFFAKVLAGYFLPILVLPFNFVVLATLYSLRFRQESSDLVLLYFKPGSPEENYYYHTTQLKRFEKFKKLFPELPVFGEWTVSQGIDGAVTHKEDWKYAWDFVITDDKDKEYSNTGLALEDYYCFGTPVVAPLDGEVVRVIDNIPDNLIGETNLKENWGNSIIISHGEGLFSSLSHLKMNSIKVRKGDNIRKGQTIAQCGNSGRSPLPHLHFQFQLSDKLGAATYKFPISHYIEKNGTELQLKTFDYPEEGTKVRNIETHKILKRAFEFQLGEKSKIEFRMNGISHSETWEVKADMNNNVYLESSKNSKVYIYPKEKVFYLTDFIGNKKSALHYFYLTASSVPLTYNENMFWIDFFPISHTTNSFTKYLSEFLLMISPQLESKSLSTFHQKINGQSSFVIANSLNNKGRGIFRFYNLNGNGKLIINGEGEIKSFSYQIGKTNFEAKIL